MRYGKLSQTSECNVYSSALTSWTDHADKPRASAVKCKFTS